MSVVLRATTTTTDFGGIMKIYGEGNTKKPARRGPGLKPGNANSISPSWGRREANRKNTPDQPLVGFFPAGDPRNIRIGLTKKGRIADTRTARSKVQSEAARRQAVKYRAARAKGKAK